MAKVILCGYRDWAIQIFDEIKLFKNIHVVDIITSNEDYLQKENKFDANVDLILFIGWSWIIPKEITEKFLCLGIHPSDLPFYRGGTPLQHQIINGINKTKITLMTLSSAKLDAGEIWLKEDLDLSGDTISTVFNHLVESSVNLLRRFFGLFPNIKPVEQDITKGSYYNRRKPSESKLPINSLKEKSLKELYDFIRALTDPYPNAYIEDEEGNKLIFKEVRYIPKIKL
jgi:methionyl-tRNA formyltransferase